MDGGGGRRTGEPVTELWVRVGDDGAPTEVGEGAEAPPAPGEAPRLRAEDFAAPAVVPAVPGVRGARPPIVGLDPSLFDLPDAVTSPTSAPSIEDFAPPPAHALAATAQGLPLGPDQLLAFPVRPGGAEAPPSDLDEPRVFGPLRLAGGPGGHELDPDVSTAPAAPVPIAAVARSGALPSRARARRRSASVVAIAAVFLLLVSLGTQLRSVLPGGDVEERDGIGLAIDAPTTEGRDDVPAGGSTGTTALPETTGGIGVPDGTTPSPTPTEVLEEAYDASVPYAVRVLAQERQRDREERSSGGRDGGSGSTRSASGGSGGTGGTGGSSGTTGPRGSNPPSTSGSPRSTTPSSGDRRSPRSPTTTAAGRTPTTSPPATKPPTTTRPPSSSPATSPPATSPPATSPPSTAPPSTSPPPTDPPETTTTTAPRTTQTTIRPTTTTTTTAPPPPPPTEPPPTEPPPPPPPPEEPPPDAG